MSLYAALGVSPAASEAELRSSYRRRALECHPDKPGGDAARFILVVKAFETLTDHTRRAQYDEQARRLNPHPARKRSRASQPERPQPSGTQGTAPAASARPQNDDRLRRPSAPHSNEGTPTSSSQRCDASNTSDEKACDSSTGAGKMAADKDDVASWLAQLRASPMDSWINLLVSRTLRELEALIAALPVASEHKPQGVAPKRARRQGVPPDGVTKTAGRIVVAELSRRPRQNDEGDSDEWEAELEEEHADTNEDEEDEAEEVEQQQRYLLDDEDVILALCDFDDDGEGEELQHAPALHAPAFQPHQTKLRGVFRPDRRRSSSVAAVALQGFYVISQTFRTLEDAVDCHIWLVRWRQLAVAELARGMGFSAAILKAWSEVMLEWLSTPLEQQDDAASRLTLAFRFTSQFRMQGKIFNAPVVWDVHVALSNHSRLVALRASGVDLDSEVLMTARQEMRAAGAEVRKHAMEQRRAAQEVNKCRRRAAKSEARESKRQEREAAVTQRRKAAAERKNKTALESSLSQELRRRKAFLQQRFRLPRSGELPIGLDCGMSAEGAQEPFVFARLTHPGVAWGFHICGPMRRRVEDAAADFQLLEKARQQGGAAVATAKAAELDEAAMLELFCQTCNA